MVDPLTSNSYKPKNNKTFLVLLIIILIISSLIIWGNNNKTLSVTNIRFITATSLISSLILTVLFFVLITWIFGTLKRRHWIFDFIIGDEGTYSLSRLQAVLWVVVIIGYQISVIIVLLLNHNGETFYYYQPVFSESSIWLLGLSLSSCIAVKGITVDKISKYPSLYNSKGANPQWSDLLQGENGLDFSKCQMLVWTIIAIFAYYSKCYYYINHLLVDDPTKIVQIFNHTYEEYSNKIDLNSSLPYVPYLPWTFVVLMGLSQGAYVGKKLVPTFKIDDAKQQLSSDYNNKISKINIDIQAKQALSNNVKPISTIGIQNMRQIQLSIQDLNSKKAEYQTQLTKINN